MRRGIATVDEMQTPNRVNQHNQKENKNNNKCFAFKDTQSSRERHLKEKRYPFILEDIDMSTITTILVKMTSIRIQRIFLRMYLLIIISESWFYSQSTKHNTKYQKKNKKNKSKH